MLELVIVVLYFIAMVAIGVLSWRRARGANGFFVADRKQSSLFITGSLLATIIGGSATVGMAGLGFTQGLTGAWWLLVGSIGLLVLGLFLARKVRDLSLYTLPELAGKQYDRRISLAASILIVVAWLGVVAGQILAAGKIMSVLDAGSPTLWMVIFTLVFVSYTAVAGQYAVIRTDVVQAGIIFIGIFVGLAVLMTRLGGSNPGLSPEQLSFPLSSGFKAFDLVKLLLLVGLTYVVGPDMYSRLFCARDVKTARRSALWTALLIVPLAFGITLIGMGAAALFPQISPEQAFPTVIREVFPPFVGGIVLAALLAAVMSSADTTLLTTSTILSVDIIGRFRPSLDERKTVFISRWGIVVLGGGSLLLALALQGVINALLFAYTVYTAGIILPVLAGFYKRKLRVTTAGALAAIIGGGSAGLISKLFNIKYLDLGALAISAFLLFAVSYIDNLRKKKQLDDEPAI